MGSRTHQIGVLVIKDSWCYVGEVNDVIVGSFKLIYYIKVKVLVRISKNKYCRFVMRASGKI